MLHRVVREELRKPTDPPAGGVDSVQPGPRPRPVKAPLRAPPRPLRPIPADAISMAAALTGRSPARPRTSEIDSRRPTMSTTARRQPDRRARSDAHALFHLQAGDAKILNLRHIPGDTSPEALLERGIVRVDRATPWGNRYVVGRHGMRDHVIELYRRDLWRRIRSGELPLDELAAIAGLPLACWCHPKPCHATVLARAAQWAAEALARSPGTP